MNREMVLLVADAIERAALPAPKPAVGFNMGDWVANDLDDQTGHSCGTTACIAGWTFLLAEGRIPTTKDDVWGRAEIALGLYNTGLSSALFIGGPEHTQFTSVRPDQAAQVLRHLAETGKVDWDVASEARP